MPARPRERRAHRVGHDVRRLVARPRPGAAAPATSTTGQSSRKRATGPASSVADITTSRSSGARATPGARAPAPGRRAGCARGTRRARSSGSPRAAGPTAGARVRMPSVATSSRVSFEKRRSKRTWKPTSPPSVQPCSSAMPPRDRARGHAPRLQQEHRPVGDERRRHARRLPRAGRRHEHERRARSAALGDAADVRVDGKRREHPPGRADGNPAA